MCSAAEAPLSRATSHTSWLYACIIVQFVLQRARGVSTVYRYEIRDSWADYDGSTIVQLKELRADYCVDLCSFLASFLCC